ncbi:MAG: glutamine synthetase [Actinomycetota bacterium]|nr:glutamine synthetase [Actinomycetota bacterium]
MPTSDDASGWFSWSPAISGSWERLTDEQRAVAQRHREQGNGIPVEPIGEVHVLVHELAPGKSEIRFRPPDGVSKADLLRVAIRELQDAVAIFEQSSV